MKKLTDGFTLANGVTLPCVGFGTWKTPPEQAAPAVAAAIAAGYRHIDGAAVYANEPGVGQGIRDSGIARGDLFVTSKVWNSERGYDTTLKAFEKTCGDLGLDYLDLYLIHWPANATRYQDQWDQVNLDTWRAMTELYKAGKIRAIGVSNFLPKHLASLLETEIKPMVNQIRFHPGMMQKEIVEFSKANGIVVEAYSPLGQGKVLDDPVIVGIAAKYGKTPAQVCIRYSLQHGICPLPKSVTPSRIASNTEVFDFELSPEDMARIDAMDSGDLVDSDHMPF